MRIVHAYRALIIVLVLSASALQAQAREFGPEPSSFGFGIYGGYEYMYRTLKLVNVAAGTLMGPRAGLNLSYSMSENFMLKLTTSTGYSTGKNTQNSAAFHETFSSWDVKPTLSLQYGRYSVGAALRYEFFKVDTSLPTSARSKTYRGIEFGPSVQMIIFSIAKLFDVSIGAEYLTGTLSSLESSQLGAKLQMGLSF